MRTTADRLGFTSYGLVNPDFSATPLNQLWVADLTYNATVNSQLAIAQLEKLLNEYEALRARSQYDDISDLKDESNTIVVRLRAALDRIVPGANSYAKEMVSVDDKPVHVRIQVYIGIARAVRDDITDGWMAGIAGFSGLSSEGSDPDAPFTQDDIRAVEQRLEEIESYVIDNASITEESSADVRREFAWLRGQLRTQGRKAWLMTFVGLLGSKIADWGLSSVHLMEIYHQLIEGGGRFLLPPRL